MKVSKLREVIKRHSDRLHIEGVGAQFTKDGIIVEAAINNDMHKVNSFFTILKTFLVNEGFKVDNMKVSKTNKTQRSLYVLNEAAYLVKENDEEEEDDEIVSTSDIDDETGEILDTTTDEMDDEQYANYVLDAPVIEGGDLLPDDEDNIQLVLADNIDELETDIVDEEEAGEVKTMDINAHGGEGPLPESRQRRMLRESNQKRGSAKARRPFRDNLNEVNTRSEESKKTFEKIAKKVNGTDPKVIADMVRFINKNGMPQYDKYRKSGQERTYERSIVDELAEYTDYSKAKVKSILDHLKRTKMIKEGIEDYVNNEEMFVLKQFFNEILPNTVFDLDEAYDMIGNALDIEKEDVESLLNDAADFGYIQIIRDINELDPDEMRSLSINPDTLDAAMFNESDIWYRIIKPI